VVPFPGVLRTSRRHRDADNRRSTLPGRGVVPDEDQRTAGGELHLVGDAHLRLHRGRPPGALDPLRLLARRPPRGASTRRLPARPRATSRTVRSRVSADVRPGLGGGSFTPARRALDSPMAIACFVERAPCLPSRTCSISSRTNSPAWVLGAFPSFLSSSARSRVSFSGIDLLLRCDESTGSSGPAQSRTEIAEGWGRLRQV